MCNCDHNPVVSHTINVAILWHQSNSVGRCPGGTIPAIDTYIHQMSRALPIVRTNYVAGEDMDIIFAQEPLQNWAPGIDPGERGWMFELIQLIRDNPTDHWVILPAAIGNSGFSAANPAANNWQPGGILYNDLVDRVNYMKNSFANGNYTLNFDFIAGIGGENDTEGVYWNPNFATDFYNFFNSLKIAINEPDIKILAGTMADDFTISEGANAVTNNNIILNLGANVTNAAGVDLTDPILTTCDGIHFSANTFEVGGVPVNESVPERFAAAYATL